MKKDQDTRYLTIQTRWQKCRYGLFMNRKPVPEIRISGIWLAEQGFFPKRKIRVVVRKRYLGIEDTQA